MLERHQSQPRSPGRPPEMLDSRWLEQIIGAPTPKPHALNEWSMQEIEETASRLSAVAHPLRLAIVCLLSSGERSVSEICDLLWTSQPNISQHLSILLNRNLVATRKEASRVYYSLSDQRLKMLIPIICCVRDTLRAPG